MNAHTNSPHGGGTDRAAAPLLAVAWLFLVTLAVIGRAWQPALNVTPMAAVALAAGAFFPSVILAASVPVAALAIGNISLAPYDHPLIAFVVFAVFTWPVLLGHLGFLGRPGRDTRWLNVVGGAFGSSLFFPLVDIAHWYCTDMYPKTAEGLVTSLVAGIPFYPGIILGNVVWSLVVFGILGGMFSAANGLAVRRLAPAGVARNVGRLTGGPQG
jgi:hypothetical protein